MYMAGRQTHTHAPGLVGNCWRQVRQWPQGACGEGWVLLTCNVAGGPHPAALGAGASTVHATLCAVLDLVVGRGWETEGRGDRGHNAGLSSCMHGQHRREWLCGVGV
jgi:hypothetical protein